MSESEFEGSGDPQADRPPRSLEDFIREFNRLADEAQENGLSVVVLLESADPIARQSTVSKVVRGTIVTTIGLLQLALMDFFPRGQA